VNITHVLYEITATSTYSFRNLDVQNNFKAFFHSQLLFLELRQQSSMNLPHVLPEIKTFFFMIVRTYKFISAAEQPKVNDLAI